MTLKQWYAMSPEEREAAIKDHFDSWVIAWDSRQDNFDTNVSRWKTVHGWHLSPSFVRELNDKMRIQAGKLWNYTGD